MQYKVFGCKVNKYYTDRWLNSHYLSDKTGTFVASCVVTDSAKRKWVRFVKKEVQTLNESQKVYISGCGAFKNGKAQDDFFDLYPDLSLFQEKIEVLDEAPIDETTKKELLAEEEITEKINSMGDRSQKIDLGKLSKLSALKKTQIYTRKYLLIQGGCDSFCTFCLTVQKRGRHYYRAEDDIVEEILEFEQQGGKEVVLTGVNLSAWGLDNTHQIENFSQDLMKNGKSGQGSKFAKLLSYILEHTSIPRIRISSLGPEFIDDEVIALLARERIYPHFHFSIQSGSSTILQSMARHYDGDYMRRLLTKIRNIQREDSVDISIGADLIVGFPGESEADFMDTYNLVSDFQITKVHAFPFSPHTMGESVPAGKFKNQVAEDIKKERMNKLIIRAEEVRESFRASQKGKLLKILIEKASGNTFSGWSENYLEANQDSFEVHNGEIQRNSIVIGKFK